MAYKRITSQYLFFWFIVISLLLNIPSQVNAGQSDPIHEYVFLIDTSGSMENNKLLGPLRVAVDDFADTIPIDKDSLSRIWIFTFDKGLKKGFFKRDIVSPKDLNDAKVHLNSIKAEGDFTYIYRALDGVFTKLAWIPMLVF